MRMDNVIAWSEQFTMKSTLFFYNNFHDGVHRFNLRVNPPNVWGTDRYGDLRG